jgi:hypothetical protein
MINFSDDWTIQALANSRPERFYEEARNYRLMQEIKRGRAQEPGFRQTLGLKMIRLGQQMLDLSAEDSTPSTAYTPGRSTV